MREVIKAKLYCDIKKGVGRYVYFQNFRKFIKIIISILSLFLSFITL